MCHQRIHRLFSFNRQNSNIFISNSQLIPIKILSGFWKLIKLIKFAHMTKKKTLLSSAVSLTRKKTAAWAITLLGILFACDK